jgi:glucokinase
MNPYSIGVDLGGTNLRVAACESGTQFLDVVQLPTRLSDGRACVVQDMSDAIRAIQAKQSSNRSLTGIGVGAPGPLELPEGILRNPPNLHGWDGFNLREAIESTLRTTIMMDNDANASALAEQKLGLGRSRSIDSLSVLTLGTGVGNGLILDGVIRSGSSGMGGEAAI